MSELSPSIEGHVDTVYIAPSTGRKLHLPFKNNALCGESSATKEKPLAMYPPPHRSWCANCVELWQQFTDRIIEYHEQNPQ